MYKHIICILKELGTKMEKTPQFRMKGRSGKIIQTSTGMYQSIHTIKSACTVARVLVIYYQFI